MTDSLDAIANTTSTSLREAIKRAYELGRAEGLEAGKNEMRQQLAALIGFPHQGPTLLGGSVSHYEPTTPVDVVEKPIGQRLPQGSVRPAVIEALKGMTGARPADIAERTGLKENSVRGTLNILRADGITDKRNNLWFLVEQLKDKPGGHPPKENEAPAEKSGGASEPGDQGATNAPGAFS
ncbi:hypothetical protein [Phreatobacter sp.]|uniref:hypothetical protein n=1 Tax=Phreatobacter sp. TaxID=1966341 RepID=UPI003F7259B6